MKVKNKFTLAKSKALKKAIDQMPAKIGNISVKYFKASFRKKGFDGHKWKPRKQQANGSLMIQSGALKRSVRRTHLSARKVIIEAGDSKVRYAKIHNQGGTIHQVVSPKQRAFFRAKSKASTQNNNKWTAMSKAKKLNIPIPKRQYMGKSKYLNIKVNKMIVKTLNNIL